MSNVFESALFVKNTPREEAENELRLLASRARGPVMVTPELAQRVIDHLNFEGQRNVREARILKHVQRIKSGTWRGSFPVTFAQLPDERLLNIDGQHRMHAIARGSAACPVTILFAPAACEAEARRLYAGFDEPDSKRSSSEVLDAVGLSGEMDLPRSYTSKLFAALPILGNGLEVEVGSAIDPEKYVKLFSTDGRLNSISEWRAEAAEYLQAVKKTTGKVRSKMQSAGCMAVALHTYRYQPSKAREFWHGLAENDGLRRTDPRAALLRDMVERNSNAGSMRQTVQAPCLAWNAWCEGRDLKIIKCITGAAITLWGTPINGKGGNK